MTISASGNVGIGTTSPAYKLDVSGSNARFNNSGGSFELDIVSNAVTSRITSTSTVFALGSLTNNPVIFWTNADEKMRIAANGNVGIGNISPSFKLDVSGSSRFTDNMTITGSLTVITGSAIEFQVTNTGVRIGNSITDIHTVTGSLSTSGSFNINGITIKTTGSIQANTATQINVLTGSNFANTLISVSTAFNFSSSVSPYSSSLQYISSSVTANTISFFTTASLIGTIFSANTLNAYTFVSGSTTTNFSGATNEEALVLKTISEGTIMNSSSSLDVSGSLASGSEDNIRFQIANSDTAAGTFRVAIRPAGATLANQHYIAFDSSVQANDTITLTLGITLATTDIITVYASSANFSFNAYGSEIS